MKLIKIAKSLENGTDAIKVFENSTEIAEGRKLAEMSQGSAGKGEGVAGPSREELANLPQVKTDNPAQTSGTVTGTQSLAGVVTNPGEILDGFGIPRYYTYTTRGQSVFVTPHAMKHLEELATHGAGNPDYLRLLGEVHQKALNATIDDVLSRGPVEYRKMYYSNGNEIMFGAPREEGLLPAVIHFR